MRLSASFQLSEFTRSGTAAKLGISNQPSPAHVEALRLLCVHVLQPVRARVGRPVRITSGYRSPALNAEVKGSASSQHCKGEAADIKVDGLSAEALAREIVLAGLPFDQVIWYADDNGGQVHVSYTPGRQRGETLYSPSKGVYRAWKV